MSPITFTGFNPRKRFKITAVLLLILPLCCLRASAGAVAPSAAELLHALSRSQFEARQQFQSVDQAYFIRVHSPKVVPLLHANYSTDDIVQLTKFLNPITRISIGSSGLVQAADRTGTENNDPTHYDAIWMRDTLWAYLAFSTDPERRPEAKRILRRMLDYVASVDQLKRMSAVIRLPSLLNGPEGQMNAIHIRFDGRSPGFLDVQVNGKPERWNHKQNDAIGLLLDLSLRSLESGETDPVELTPLHWEALASLPAYLGRIRFYEMEDAGAWEEIERTNTSSTALVTSAIEELQKILGGRSPQQIAIATKLRSAASRLNRLEWLQTDRLAQLVDRGYDRIHRQLKQGGESPLYPKMNAKYRRADAALLNLIYPARLSRLGLKEKMAILQTVESLAGEVGIRRYQKDSYQSGNFWLSSAQTDQGKTGNTSSKEQFKKREQQLLAGSEAEWFFDSWFSIAASKIFRESGQSIYHSQQIAHFNRALGQITGCAKGQTVLAADGNSVPELALPESYNILVSGQKRLYAPSPITPLNWAKACLALAVRELGP